MKSLFSSIVPTKARPGADPGTTIELTACASALRAEAGRYEESRVYLEASGGPLAPP